MIRTIKKTDRVIVIGINALNDRDTASGTPAGILIAQFFWTKNRYSSAEMKAVKIPRNIPSAPKVDVGMTPAVSSTTRSEEHTSELQSRFDLVCRLLLEKKKYQKRRASRAIQHTSPI